MKKTIKKALSKITAKTVIAICLVILAITEIFLDEFHMCIDIVFKIIKSFFLV